MKSCNVWLIHSKIARWVSLSLRLIFTFVSLQTLTTLMLGCIRLEARDALDLANFLRTNTVICTLLFVYLSYTSVFIHVVTHHTLSSTQWNIITRCTAFGWSIKDQHGNLNLVFLFISCRSLICHRHSLHSIYVTMKSKYQEYDAWLMHYKLIR